MRTKTLTKRYLYRLHTAEQQVGATLTKVADVLAALKENPDIVKIVKIVQAYNSTGCHLISQQVLPRDKFGYLEEVSYKLLKSGNVVADEAIYNFAGALAKARESDDAEGLLEITKTFDGNGNQIKQKRAYLIQGDVLEADKLPNLKNKVFCNAHSGAKIKNEKMKDITCVISPSGVVAFLGKSARFLEAEYRVF
mgnify:CR=1 FL=1